MVVHPTDNRQIIGSTPIPWTMGSSSNERIDPLQGSDLGLIPRLSTNNYNYVGEADMVLPHQSVKLVPPGKECWFESNLLHHAGVSESAQEPVLETGV